MHRVAAPLFLLVLLAPAQAQEGVGSPFWVQTPAAARSALDRAVAAVAGEEWDDAARELQRVFEKFGSSFVASSRRGHYVGARHRAMSLLLTMPQDVRGRYQHLYGRRADEALRQSFASHDRKVRRSARSW